MFKLIICVNGVLVRSGIVNFMYVLLMLKWLFVGLICGLFVRFCEVSEFGMYYVFFLWCLIFVVKLM